ncbi:iron-containing alcohol dehydrogenase [Alicyclobacillus dauci]|uniref:Iron-containing alcohol dehydrogenase n=1 Tax=Alicyclobacillus dauci TaxID=1475485 RepID=A0ABY6Z544_9BACL|nr:iron-containing alcohol dehydrogenase [Alicyclobacillus dauci]WAH38007.1 iron-containing alcohol dehydrogenase [Alicyclobacillus dauci]
MNSFQMFIPTNVHFGEGKLEELPDHVKSFQAERVLLVTDSGLMTTGLIDSIEQLLRNAGVEVEVYADVEPDPSVETVHKVAERFSDMRGDLLLAVGGGSSMDTAKGARIVALQGGHIRDYSGLQAKPIRPNRNIPLIVLPTTAGTGSEVTFFGVFSDWENKVKVTVTSPFLAPNIAIVDPALTRTVPSHITASTGIDVLAHAVETYVSRAANPFSEKLAESAVALVGEHLRTAVFYGENRLARYSMAQASLLAGVAFNHSFLGLTHAIAAAVSGYAHVPHGVAIGLLLPAVMDYNLRANRTKFRVVSRILSGDSAATEQDAPVLVRQLAMDIGIPQHLRDVGVTEDMLDGIAKDSMQSVQLRFNPRPATALDVRALLDGLY